MDALWLSPIYPSPLADFGYDVSDYTDVDPAFGSLEGFDACRRSPRARHPRAARPGGVPHVDRAPWFREHPDWYIWSNGDGPRNNWTCLRRPAWARDEVSGRWYLHSFYPEQPDLDWHNPGVIAAMQGVIRFWIDRGVDGFRLDAIDRLLKDPQLRDDPLRGSLRLAPRRA